MGIEHKALSHKPTEFSWCPDEMWNAFVQGRDFGLLSHNLVVRILNSLPYRETICRMLFDCRCQTVLDTLFSAELRENVFRENAVYSTLQLAAAPADLFMPRTDRAQAKKGFERVIRCAKNLRRAIEQMDKAALQSKTDEDTNFSETGRFLNTSLLLNHLDSYLTELIRECQLPFPERSDLIPRKLNSSSAQAHIKIRLMHMNMKKLYVKPLYQVIADLTTVALDLPHALTYDDVRKACA